MKPSRREVKKLLASDVEVEGITRFWVKVVTLLTLERWKWGLDRPNEVKLSIREINTDIKKTEEKRKLETIRKYTLVNIKNFLNFYHLGHKDSFNMVFHLVDPNSNFVSRFTTCKIYL